MKVTGCIQLKQKMLFKSSLATFQKRNQAYDKQLFE
jgi:hypothetical protein